MIRHVEEWYADRVSRGKLVLGSGGGWPTDAAISELLASCGGIGRPAEQKFRSNRSSDLGAKRTPIEEWIVRVVEF